MDQRIWIVITTINHPTQAIKDFSVKAKSAGWNIIVVGDTKTPADWNWNNCIYLSVEKQLELFPTVAKMIPVKHYCRKNIGYLYAIQQGATIIIDTDDDNLPYDNFAQELEEKVQGNVVGDSQWVNIYSYYADNTIWPRGLPLDYIHVKGSILGQQNLKCPVQQYLADKDPDVDAIFRLINKQDTYFNKNAGSYIIDKGTYVPFNSQNTIFFKEVFPLLYLPCFVSFRMTDIWRSFIVQRILDHLNYNLVFHPPTVWQDRNQHDLTKDFNDEVIGYQRNKDIIDHIKSVDLTGLDMKNAIISIWKAVQSIGIITEEEMKIVMEWLKYF